MGSPLALAILCLFATVTAGNVKRAPAAPTVPPTPALVNLSMKATALETLGEIGLQTRVPIGIIPGSDAGALCRTKTTFVFLGEDPRSALDAMAQQLQYTLNQVDGVFLLMAPDITPHQREVLEHRFRVYRTGRKLIVQMISVQLSEALWDALGKSVSAGYGGSIYHSADAPQIPLPPVLHNVTAQDIAGIAVKSGTGGIYLSRIQPSRMASPEDLTIQISSYGDPNQLKQDMNCQR
jgi:hypothetical protein